MDEVLELGGTAVRPVDDVVPVNPQMYVEADLGVRVGASPAVDAAAASSTSAYRLSIPPAPHRHLVTRVGANARMNDSDQGGRHPTEDHISQHRTESLEGELRVCRSLRKAPCQVARLRRKSSKSRLNSPGASSGAR